MNPGNTKHLRVARRCINAIQMFCVYWEDTYRLYQRQIKQCYHIIELHWYISYHTILSSDQPANLSEWFNYHTYTVKTWDCKVNEHKSGIVDSS